MEHMLGEHGPDQDSSIKCRPASSFRWISVAEHIDQVIPGNLLTKYHPTVGGVQLVIEWCLKY